MLLTSTSTFRRRLSICLLFASTLGNCLLLPTTETRMKPKLKFCKMDVLFYCFYEPIAGFTNTPSGTGFPTTDADLEQWCFSLHDYFPYCARDWMRRCSSPLHSATFDALYLEPFQQSLREVCSNQSARAEFLRHADCIVHNVKLSAHYRDSCVRHFQGDFEVAGRNHRFEDVYRGSCCAWNAWERCISGQIGEQCGPQATAIFTTFMRHLTVSLFASFCPVTRFNPADREEQCPPALYRASDGYIPLGLNSTNFFSHSFALNCPNVAYGVDPRRDGVGF